MKTKRMWLWLVILSLPAILILSQCDNLKSKQDARGELYAGSVTCRQCHKAIYDSYLQTAHYQTTRSASIHSIHGSFAKNGNTFTFSNGTKVVMEKRDSGLYQVAYANQKPGEAHRFDISFGGIKAESYLYWNNDKLYQLPMSYFSALHSWTNSPGFDTSHADYSRLIGRRCFECHSSYLKDLPQPLQSLQQVEEFDKKSLILGIDCERCHGPATNHVNYHLEYPKEKKAKYIVTINTLTRQQKIDACAVCHSGNKNMVLTSTFSFKPGDTLAKYIESDFSVNKANPANLDVHGNQSQMLASSQCFIRSKMDCNTCHNTHQNERNNLLAYSQKCLQCHSPADHNFCKMKAMSLAVLKKNCLDCHMPAKPSNVIAVQTSGKGQAIPYLVRTHHIAVYPNDADKIKRYVQQLDK